MNSSKCCRGIGFWGSLRGHQVSEIPPPQEPQCAERMVPGKGAKAVPREWFKYIDSEKPRDLLQSAATGFA